MPADSPSLLESGRDQLSRLERLQIRAIRSTFTSKTAGDVVRWLQWHVGKQWIHYATNRLHQVHHIERVPPFDLSQSFILVCNHRSFFDLYVVTSTLMRYGFHQRCVFPVRSDFFYDSPLGFVVNGVMSFFAMYPPIFRDRNRASLNVIGLQELVGLLKAGGHFVGFHPEGTRNHGDPYQLLPARQGIGRLAHAARVPVIPVFTNGLLVSDLVAQVRSNFDGTGVPIHTVFGGPVELSELLDQPGSASVYKQIAVRIREEIMKLGEEEKELRRTSGD